MNKKKYDDFQSLLNDDNSLFNYLNFYIFIKKNFDNRIFIS